VTPPEHLLTWVDAAGLVDRGPADGPLLAADSWLVSDGLARALDRHRSRFGSACAAAGAVPPERMDEFWSAAVDRLPRSGQWFPRVELAEAGRPVLRLRIRPAPPLTDAVRVWIAGCDPRRAPQRKGPDLDRLAVLRHAASRQAADEALLTTPSGILLEAASSSLLWWEGEALCLPSPELPTLPGVTAALVRDRAARLGVPIRHRRSRLADLAEREVWLTNALHGIRPVVGWVGQAVPAAEPRQAAAWQRWLRDQTTPLPPATYGVPRPRRDQRLA
jgi:branched-subunit amino acid aminotransferase/4-amino-4-deoxychorismate lyase